MKTLYLIRHALTYWNKERIVQGYMNSPVLPEEQKKIKKIAKRFSAKQFDKIYCSSRGRAIQTAENLINKTNHINITPLLDEIHLGEWEGQKIDDLMKIQKEKIRMWFSTPNKVKIKNGESIYQLRNRVKKFFRIIEKEKVNNILAVTHGGWIAVAITYVLGISVNKMWDFVTDNLSLTVLIYDKKWIIKLFNAPLSSNEINKNLFKKEFTNEKI